MSSSYEIIDPDAPDIEDFLEQSKQIGYVQMQTDLNSSQMLTFVSIDDESHVVLGSRLDDIIHEEQETWYEIKSQPSEMLYTIAIGVDRFVYYIMAEKNDDGESYWIYVQK